MSALLTQFKQLLFIAALVFCAAGGMAQAKITKETREYKNFTKITARAGISFSLPNEFKEIPVNTENSSYDYGMTLPGQEFEIWFKITPAAENTPDSLYLENGKNEAKALAGENSSLARTLPERVLSDYNADAGKTYFISLPDSPGTRHYKYALLITLQKNRKGNIMAVCLTNDKGPDFFKNINKASNCIKFKAGS